MPVGASSFPVQTQAFVLGLPQGEPGIQEHDDRGSAVRAELQNFQRPVGMDSGSTLRFGRNEAARPLSLSAKLAPMGWNHAVQGAFAGIFTVFESLSGIQS